jgi:hypothetical protein
VSLDWKLLVRAAMRLNHFVRRYVSALLCALMVIAVSSGVSIAKETKKPQAATRDYPMRFAIVRASSPSCEPVCPEWIWAEGDIKRDTAARFKKFLKTVGDRQLPVIIYSAGGDVASAFEMGRLIRKRKLDVAVGYTTFTSCDPRSDDCDSKKLQNLTGYATPNMAFCNSACPLVLMSGVRRLAGDFTRVGVHQVTTTMRREKILTRTTTRVVKGKKVVKKAIIKREKAPSIVTTKMNKTLRRQFNAHLNEMGVSLEMIKLMEKTPAADIYHIPQRDLLPLGLVTGPQDLRLFTSPLICKQTPLPGNCREVPSEETAAQIPKSPAQKRPSVASDGPLPVVPGQMKISFVKGEGADCNPKCPKWISAEGLVARDSVAELRSLLAKTSDKPIAVVLNSTGGDLFAAMEFGRIVRNNGLSVFVAKTEFKPCGQSVVGCRPRDGYLVGSVTDSTARCEAVCALILSGGVGRFAGSGASVVVNELGMEAKVTAYLEEMGPGYPVLALMQSARFGKHRTLTNDEMLRSGLITGSQTAASFMPAANR